MLVGSKQGVTTRLLGGSGGGWDVPEIVGGRGADTRHDGLGGIKGDGVGGDGDLLLGEHSSAISVTQFADRDEVGVVQGWEEVGLSGGRGQFGNGQSGRVGGNHGVVVGHVNLDGFGGWFLVDGCGVVSGIEVAGAASVGYIELGAFVRGNIEGFLGCGGTSRHVCI